MEEVSQFCALVDFLVVDMRVQLAFEIHADVNGAHRCTRWYAAHRAMLRLLQKLPMPCTYSGICSLYRVWRAGHGESFESSRVIGAGESRRHERVCSVCKQPTPRIGYTTLVEHLEFFQNRSTTRASDVRCTTSQLRQGKCGG